MRAWNAALLALAASFALAQTEPTFDAASVKPSPDRPLPNFRVNSGRLSVKSVSVHDLILRAFGMEAFQLSGTAGWMDTQGFALEASAGSGVTSAEMNGMLRSLLAERFHLRIHSERREVAVFALHQAKSGAKIPRSDGTPGQSEQPAPDRAIIPVALDIPGLVRYLNTRSGPAAIGRPVIDRTGLEGNFNIRLEFGFIRNEDNNGGRFDIDYPSALQQQLGLRLDPERAEVEYWVVDSAGKPSDN